MWFNKKSNKNTEDKGWQAMNILLDKELPENKRRRRGLIWLWPVAASFIGAVFYFSSSNELAPRFNKAAHMKPQPVAMTSPPSEVTLQDAASHESLIAENREASSQKNTATRIPSSSGTNAKGAALLTVENEKILPKNESLVETLQQDRAAQITDYTVETATAEPKSERTLTKLKNIATLPYDLKYQKVMPQMMSLPFVVEKSKVLGVHPYAVAGVFAPPALDRAGFAIGGGLALQYKKWLGFTVGVQYEKYRGKYDYQNIYSSNTSDLNSLSAYTDVKQFSIPVLLHVRVPSTPVTIFGGVAKNFVQKTANYYAIPSRSQAELNPGLEINSVDFASTAAASIPDAYYEWQLGVRIRMWNKWSLGLQYREQFEKLRNGIIPGFNHLGLNLSYALP